MLTRDAEIIAIALFPFGHPQKTWFDSIETIHERTLTALCELERREMIANLPSEGDRIGWVATEELGYPLGRFQAIQPGESFPVTNPRSIG